MHAFTFNPNMYIQAQRGRYSVSMIWFTRISQDLLHPTPICEFSHVFLAAGYA